MSSVFGSVVMSFLSLVTPTNPVTGKPWEPYLLPYCRDLAPAALQSTWGLREIPVTTSANEVSLGCHFKREDREVIAIYECGGRNLQRGDGIMRKPTPVNWAAQKPRATVNDKKGQVRLVDYDDDTPCKVMLLWPDSKGTAGHKKKCRQPPDSSHGSQGP